MKARMIRVQVSYVVPRESGVTTYGVCTVEVPRGASADAVRQALAERRPGAVWTHDHIRAIADRAVRKDKAACAS